MPVPGFVFKAVNATHAGIYRATNGKFGGKMGKAPILLLTTKGRKSGQERTSPLLFLKDGERWIVVGSKGGSPEHPAWFKNLEATPKARIEVGAEKVDVTSRVATQDERAGWWPQLVEMYGGYAKYQEKTTRQIPVIVLEKA